MEKVSWKIPKYKASAEDAYKEMSSLEKLTPQNLVELARDENSALHNDFEWNDTIAGEKYRNIQASEMIRLIVIQSEEAEHEPIRVFQKVEETHTYEPVRLIVQHKDEYQALLRRAKAELKAFENRYKSLVELQEVFKEIDRL